MTTKAPHSEEQTEEQTEEQPRPTLVQRFLGSRLVTGLGMVVSRHASPWIGYAIGGVIAGLINRLRPDVYWVLYANLRQVVGPGVDERALHRMVRRVFRNTARNNYELWHLVGQGPAALKAAVRIPSDFWERVDQARQAGRGAVIVGVHTGNFDVALLALAADRKDETLVLGIATPPTGGFDLMDHMRARMGVNITSIGVPGLREAIRRLRGGGIIVTGVDRPVGDEEHRVEFFGRPAPLPTGHVRLALKTDAVIFVAGAHRETRRRNVVHISPPLEMVRTGDADEDLRVNMRRTAALLEEFIRAWPQQWGMYVPVWPERDA